MSFRIFLCLCFSAFCAPVQATSVVFFNPGYSSESFWVDYSRYMQDAAGDLGMELEVLYGERDNETVLRNARALLERQRKPDYLLFSNEQYLGPEILRLLADSGIRLFTLHSTLTVEQQRLAGGSREKYANWIGSLVANDEEAGYLMARDLLKGASEGSELVAFSGVKNTPSATLREEGLHRALAERPQVRLRQLLYGEWSRQRAYEQAGALLPRYPNVALVWSANDEMAFGAMQAAEEQGRRLAYTALNNSERALRARMDGRIGTLATGHFILGGCALVMLHDHAAGMDFAERGGKDQMARLLRLVDAGQAKKLLKRIGSADLGLDFRRFSATRNRAMKAYSCSIDSLLR
ncbi:MULTISPECIES: ABC transporter substrate-binding protein [unclassified Pseudomonas]|uniref:ABC transporter substrate-binding protein n=1 Tax=unclassified Pseudomonas TaxID=196821 RepID=UPI002447C93A|nr:MULTISPECIES: ABC transporter substrate-binding protein [unclassified Pseudomonas]MDH0894634.1 ABC transporter substrate-binding protein [Pseudomonas sp. GD03875]MDH1067231.1 ABC transporter substrate-binding protein [Pseudomonas sp. GD03985]